VQQTVASGDYTIRAEDLLSSVLNTLPKIFLAYQKKGQGFLVTWSLVILVCPGTVNLEINRPQGIYCWLLSLCLHLIHNNPIIVDNSSLQRSSRDNKNKIALSPPFLALASITMENESSPLANSVSSQNKRKRGQNKYKPRFS
jgi:hypothetical protein